MRLGKELLQGQDPVFPESPKRPEMGSSPSPRRGPPAGTRSGSRSRSGSGSGSGMLSLVTGHWGPGGKYIATEAELLPGSRPWGKPISMMMKFWASRES